jgi:hypothetical protein
MPGMWHGNSGTQRPLLFEVCNSAYRVAVTLRNPIKVIGQQMSSTRRSAIVHIFGVSRGAVADVMDAHLETLSMIFLTTCWAVGYGWFEAVIGIGYLLGIPGTPGSRTPWYEFLGSYYSAYHLFFGFTVFVITFGIGFLKFNRMLYARKRYLLFTSLASYPWALTVQDFAYFFFSPIFGSDKYGLNSHAWTCHGLNLGCAILANPWKPDIPFIIPRWYVASLAVSALLFFLAYRSALVNLLVTRQVMKEIGFTEKVRVGSSRVRVPVDVVPRPAGYEATPAPPRASETRAHGPEVPPNPAKETKAVEIVDKDREALKKRLRERLERRGP